MPQTTAKRSSPIARNDGPATPQCWPALAAVLHGLAVGNDALDGTGARAGKYGRPLPSMDEPEHEAREEEETLFGGYLLTGAFVKNPTFAARPDNTGLVGMRHMLHLETDLYKQYLTFYTDQNFSRTAPTDGSS